MRVLAIGLLLIVSCVAYLGFREPVDAPNYDLMTPDEIAAHAEADSNSAAHFNCIDPQNLRARAPLRFVREVLKHSAGHDVSRREDGAWVVRTGLDSVGLGGSPPPRLRCVLAIVDGRWRLLERDTMATH